MFIGYDPGEAQFFSSITVPENVMIPCGDPSSYILYPEHNWVYNKIQLCRTQNIPAYPHGVAPEHLPVISKPITNLYGMSRGIKKLYSWNDDLDYIPGHFWMPIYTGPHLSTDFAVIDGIAKWDHSFLGYKNAQDRFTYWEYVCKDYESIVEMFRLWIHNNLKEYTGIVNIESIGNRIIECHLRMSPQFIDLYGNDWLDCVVDLYSKEQWAFEKTKTSGFSVPLWTSEPGNYEVDYGKVEELRKKVSSIQITFDENYEVSKEIYQSDYFRLAIVNDFNFENAKQTCEKLKEFIILTQ